MFAVVHIVVAAPRTIKASSPSLASRLAYGRSVFELHTAFLVGRAVDLRQLNPRTPRVYR